MLLAVVSSGIGAGLEGQVPFYIKGATDAHWTSNIPGYYIVDRNRMPVWNTNTHQFWRGYWNERFWDEDTNGWRVQISFYTNSPRATITVEVGSVAMNSGMRYYSTPDHKFAKFELSDSSGVVIPPKWGASLKGDYQHKISTRDYPGWGGHEGEAGGYLVRFFSNGPPCRLVGCELNKAYSIKSEGDYTLTVCPVLYKQEANQTNFDRVDLPCVTAKVHLKPTQ
jgi:hypothetical protein